ncbi:MULTISPECIES: hypothetical protein [unclassified Nocardia]|uniref:hypothetical protein n=1 Tax=unclassified Nocardia TaxID=2637762 RepID=UPI001CE47E95|nr:MULTISPECIES: hypothetical protein [unclassified Nocardia]
MYATRLAAVLSSCSLIPEFIVGTAVALASPGQPSVHGCPAGTNCTYATTADFNANRPTTITQEPPQNAGITFAQLQTLNPGLDPGQDDLDVNNTDPWFTSEGNYVLSVGGLVCIYHPDPLDEQAPDTTEPGDPAHPVSIVAFGPTAASVDSDIIVDIGNCS